MTMVRVSDFRQFKQHAIICHVSTALVFDKEIVICSLRSGRCCSLHVSLMVTFVMSLFILFFRFSFYHKNTCLLACVDCWFIYWLVVLFHILDLGPWIYRYERVE